MNSDEPLRDSIRYKSLLKISLLLTLALTLLTGVLYPIFITLIAQVFFPHAANGSLIVENEKLRGSILIGQHFQDPKFFWSRPSATHPYPYNALQSGGSNLGPSNPVYIESIKERIAKLRHSVDTPSINNLITNLKNSAVHSENNSIPIDLVTTSGSGLDPHISVESAKFQMTRVAAYRQIPETILQELIEKHKELRHFGFLGEEKINVLKLNLALEAEFPMTTSSTSRQEGKNRGKTKNP